MTILCRTGDWWKRGFIKAYSPCCGGKRRDILASGWKRIILLLNLVLLVGDAIRVVQDLAISMVICLVLALCYLLPFVCGIIFVGLVFVWFGNCFCAWMLWYSCYLVDIILNFVSASVCSELTLEGKLDMVAAFWFFPTLWVPVLGHHRLYIGLIVILFTRDLELLEFMAMTADRPASCGRKYAIDPRSPSRIPLALEGSVVMSEDQLTIVIRNSKSLDSDTSSLMFGSYKFAPLLITYWYSCEVNDSCDMKRNLVLHGEKEYGSSFIASNAIASVSISSILNHYSDHWGVNQHKKQSLHPSRSSSRENLDPRFTEVDDQTSYQSTHLHPGHEEAEGAREEVALTSIHVPTPLRQHSQLDHLMERFDQWETCFETLLLHRSSSIWRKLLGLMLM
ncbi:hypothetical protein MA16_Dca025071 [Dendrobium catenatum]|uniref:Uncharacterized protein n=1 Tax=Dendrobium catenatum TaxID=906689 RepID=A0A2I0W4B0_9ASPA|nr:hypothetical protein MA16_Dca025071 [Dendrobium catenatum]